MVLSFVKASGAGNDFVLLNNFEGDIQQDVSQLARVLCSRHFGIGAGGLIILNRSSSSDFSILYFNADGSYGGMCGNGGRCAAAYAHRLGIAGPSMKFEALDHVYSA